MQMTTALSKWIIVNDGELRYPVRTSDLRQGESEGSLRAMTAREYDEWAITTHSILKNEAFTRFLLGSDVLEERLDAMVAAGTPEWAVPYAEKVGRPSHTD